MSLVLSLVVYGWLSLVRSFDRSLFRYVFVSVCSYLFRSFDRYLVRYLCISSFVSSCVVI